MNGVGLFLLLRPRVRFIAEVDVLTEVEEIEKSG